MSTTTLDQYRSSTYGKELFVAKAKVGKTCTLIGNVLGVMPWQTNGGIVDKPENLHVITFDAAAADGVKEFLIKECGAPAEIGKVHIENLQRESEKAFAGRGDYNGQFMESIYDAVKKVQDRTVRPGVHAVLFCSLTMMAKAVLRSISGPAFVVRDGKMIKSPMDMNKWGLLKQQLSELQWHCQSDQYHTLWEAHHGEKTEKGETDSSGNPKWLDTLQVDGGTAKTFPAQVERVWEVCRSSQRYVNAQKKMTKIFNVHFNPFPNFDFGDVQTGRGVTTRLNDKEPCLATAFDKLGLKVGGYNR